MTRTQSIIEDARLTLADPDKTRWSDERLLALLNVAQNEIATKAQLIKRTVLLPVFKGQANYVLPDDVIWIERAYYDGKPLRLLDYKVVDNLSRDRVGVPTSIVFNKHPYNEVVLYPKPSNNSEAYVKLSDEIVGVATDIEELGVKIFDANGIITDLEAENLEVEVDSPYGGISDVYQILYPLEIYYIAEPKKITSLDEDPEIGPTCDKALKLYIIFSALFDDMDTQNRQSASVYAQYYNDALNDIKKFASRDHVSTITQLETNPYNGVFEWPHRP